MTTPVTTKTAFLDTNALLRLFGFWEACDIAKISMSSVASWGDLKTALKKGKNPIIDAFGRDAFGDIRQGLDCFKELNKAKKDCDYFSSQVCLSEMHRVILTSKATERLNLHRVPMSLMSKRPLLVHRIILKNSDYEQIEQLLKSFFDTLLIGHQINIQILEKSGSDDVITSILETAKAFWSRVLTETMDAYIYAAAIECHADFFLTGDFALREAAKSLSNPTGEWMSVAQALREALDKPKDFKFPEGVNTNHTLV